VGEIYRYQLVGPPHFGLTNLRTLQDYVVARRLLTIPRGGRRINSWGEDIENVVLTQTGGADPDQQRCQGDGRVHAAAGDRRRDNEDDVATAIVVMGRTRHTNDIIPRVQAEVARLNSDGSLPPGVKIVPY
jgi:Cu/Ag efflux pump CusA